MADTLSNLQARIHRASCAELLTLVNEADAAVAANPSLFAFARSNWYREFNKRRFKNCGGTSMITPFDGGLRPNAP
jgi:hypothetical protein